MIFLGVSKQEVMESTPRELWCYEDAFKLRRKHEDEVSYVMGIYTYNAVATALGNAFRGKGKKAEEYLKYPLLSKDEYEEADLQKQRQELVDKLMAMKANFESSRGDAVS